jgi:hypothetical protein
VTTRDDTRRRCTHGLVELEVHELAAGQRDDALPTVARRAHDRLLARRRPLADAPVQTRAADLTHARRVDLQNDVILEQRHGERGVAALKA